MRAVVRLFVAAVLSAVVCVVASAQAKPAEAYKEQLLRDVEAMRKQTQVINDVLFSFGELGFQEYETAKYLTGLLEKEGFKVERGVSGVPTAWVASWSNGTGRPVVALGSDVDSIPQASQKPGVAYREPLVEGAPGHGEGHNSGQAVNITAALALKRLMKRENLSGTIRVWPGVAEELLGGKAYFVRDGLFKDVDVVLFTHVSDNLSVSWGSRDATGLVSVEYAFRGQSAHSAGAPWRGRSALDAVELMNIGWNYRREHLRLQQRSHYVITNGGDQPNVVPQASSVWYYFRETDYPRIKEMWETGDKIAQGAALMTGTTYTSRVLGAAWPQHFNKTVAEAMYENIKRVGLPKWDEADQTLARAVQRELGAEEKGLASELAKLGEPVKEEDKRGAGSDDIGDVSWVVPTVTLRYPSNIPNLPGHNWANAIAMATPVAHKGATAGAKVMALTMLDLFTRPELIKQAWDYFRDVQTKEVKYTPFLGPQDKPATWMNQRIMSEYRERLRGFYYDPKKYDTYLEQLGVRYPTVRPAKPEAKSETK
ncbi:MAG TPA: amidohydrolase [Pyrinomonadaceae bacterium]|nr:amidohydrolase [Pyrinomonadaceae bacterium]